MMMQGTGSQDITIQIWHKAHTAACHARDLVFSFFFVFAMLGIQLTARTCLASALPLNYTSSPKSQHLSNSSKIIWNTHQECRLLGPTESDPCGWGPDNLHLDKLLSRCWYAEEGRAPAWIHLEVEADRNIPQEHTPRSLVIQPPDWAFSGFFLSVETCSLFYVLIACLSSLKQFHFLVSSNPWIET